MISTNPDDLIQQPPDFQELFPHFYKDPETISNTVDPFTLNSKTGFLPTQLPIAELPSQFAQLSNILARLPVLLEDGRPGLLATYALGPLIEAGVHLDDLTDHIDRLVVPDTEKLDMHLVTALFRDYSFLASSYLLEPCWQHYNERKQKQRQQTKTGAGGRTVDNASEYGLGRPVLPACIARPLVKLAGILDIPPFMSYAASYALYNYRLIDPSRGCSDYNNMRLIRAFERGLDPKSSEAGFILTHIHMVAQTGPLIAGVIETLDAVEQAESNSIDTPRLEHQLKSSLSLILTTMTSIESAMERMWSNSLPKDYPTYRTFIFGITSQPLFPNGVIYESCFDDLPQSYRGESGANDSIIPLLDSLCQIPMPVNPLTDTLKSFRAYRPTQQRTLLRYIEIRSHHLHTRSFFTSNVPPAVTILYLRVLDHIRSFRWRHWLFAREYIIKQSRYPVATGGSPIVTWLPNQLSAVLDTMENVYRSSALASLVSCDCPRGISGHGNCTDLTGSDLETVREIIATVVLQREKLHKEVEKYCSERSVN